MLILFLWQLVGIPATFILDLRDKLVGLGLLSVWTWPYAPPTPLQVQGGECGGCSGAGLRLGLRSR